jgi:hypothetical protein
MLAYFPEIYPDELLYSVLARYHRHTGAVSPKQTLNDLFGNRNTIAGMELQGGLGNLSAHLPPTLGLTPYRLALQFTLYPFYAAFQPVQVRDQALRSIIDGSISGLHFTLGLAPFRAKHRHLRFCDLCAKEMEEDFGEVYWRRTHQLPGVLVCPDHAVPLRVSGIPMPKGNRHSFVAASKDNCMGGPVVPGVLTSKAFHERLLSVAKRCAEVVKAMPAPRGLGEWAGYYRERLFAAGLASDLGRVEQAVLAEGFRVHYGAALELLLLDIGDSLSLDWLTSVTRHHRHAFHPLQHILLQGFLDDFPLKFPFGRGPWPCLNPLSDHCGQTNIRQIATHRNHGRVVGVFKCDCGYVYTRNVDPTTDIQSRPRPLQYGSQFDSLLRGLVRRHVPLREASRKLHADPKTVRLQAARLGLRVTWAPVAIAKPSKGINKKDRRRCWQTLRRNNPKAGQKGLAGMAPSIYTWLYRNDRGWLKLHQPAVQKRTHGPCQDWATLDREWELRVVRLAEEIRAESPPVKVTLAEIERRTERPGWLTNHLRHLPLTAKCITSVQDSTAAFQMRRVAWAAGEAANLGYPSAAWRIRRIAGLPLHPSPEVEAAIQALISSNRPS